MNRIQNKFYSFIDNLPNCLMDSGLSKKKNLIFISKGKIYDAGKTLGGVSL